MNQGGRASALLALTLASVGSCAHHPPAPPRSAEAKPAPNPSPGARNEAERTHVLEAQWSEVEVKAKKDGDAVASAIKLVQPKIRILHAAPPPEEAGTDPKKKRRRRPSQTRRSI